MFGAPLKVFDRSWQLFARFWVALAIRNFMSKLDSHPLLKVMRGLFALSFDLGLPFWLQRVICKGYSDAARGFCSIL